MTTPKHADDSGTSRVYKIDGEEYHSVTSIIGCLAKPALVPWAAKCAAKRAIANENVWHSIQVEEGEEAAAKWIAKAHRDESGYKMTMGSLVHHLCENYDAPELVQDKTDWFLSQLSGSRQDNERKALAHLDTWRRFLDEQNVKILHQEMTVYHRDYHYAGTLDAVVTIDGEGPYVLDIKTGGVYGQQAGMQMAAYRNATHYLDDYGYSGPFDTEIKGGVVLQLKQKSYKLHFVDTYIQTFDTFLALVKVKRNLPLIGKTGEEYR